MIIQIKKSFLQRAAFDLTMAQPRETERQQHRRRSSQYTLATFVTFVGAVDDESLGTRDRRHPRARRMAKELNEPVMPTYAPILQGRNTASRHIL